MMIAAKHPSLVTALVIGMLFACQSEAGAHPPAVSVHVAVYDQYWMAPDMPRRFRDDRDFRRWYLQSRYRYDRHPGWKRLYELYRLDVRHHRWLRNGIRRDTHGAHRHRGCRH